MALIMKPFCLTTPSLSDSRKGKAATTFTTAIVAAFLAASPICYRERAIRNCPSIPSPILRESFLTCACNAQQWLCVSETLEPKSDQKQDVELYGFR